jgi:hypothetical protein
MRLQTPGGSQLSNHTLPEGCYLHNSAVLFSEQKVALQGDIGIGFPTFAPPLEALPCARPPACLVATLSPFASINRTGTLKAKDNALLQVGPSCPQAAPVHYFPLFFPPLSLSFFFGGLLASTVPTVADSDQPLSTPMTSLHPYGVAPH